MTVWQPLVDRRACSPRDEHDCYFPSLGDRPTSPARHYDLQGALETIEVELTRLIKPGDSITVDDRPYHTVADAMVALRIKYGTNITSGTWLA
ncbi:MAG TPA: hypothetical protein VNW92_20910 [Polyangiaceae bacterium]|nr:hypothetical protein [Polyangiaceae bacterium]